MAQDRAIVGGRRGMTVLTLLLLIIAIILAAVFLVRYLRARPAVSMQPSEQVISGGASPPTFIASAA